MNILTLKWLIGHTGKDIVTFTKDDSLTSDKIYLNKSTLSKNQNDVTIVGFDDEGFYFFNINKNDFKRLFDKMKIEREDLLHYVLRELAKPSYHLDKEIRIFEYYKIEKDDENVEHKYHNIDLKFKLNNKDMVYTFSEKDKDNLQAILDNPYDTVRTRLEQEIIDVIYGVVTKEEINMFKTVRRHYNYKLK